MSIPEAESEMKSAKRLVFQSACGIILGLLGIYAALAGDTLVKSSIYVSPAGNDEWKGSREQPLATLGAALSRKGSLGGRITLLEGVYREKVHIMPSEAGTPPAFLSIESEGKVVFDGGEQISEWKAWNEKPDIYVLSVKDVRPVSIDIWEKDNRIRYREVADAAGVEAHRGSYTVLDGSRLLVHTHTAENPESAKLWISHNGVGMIVGRAQTRIRGIQFRNYLGGRYSTPIQIEADDVEIAGCEISNSTTGILINPGIHHTKITDCSIRGVGNGITNLGDKTHILNCVIQSASGDFAIKIHPHLRNGIRCYNPARGGIIENCVTAGFWAGIYIKTFGKTSDLAQPFIIQNNTFLDGIVAASGEEGPQPQPLNRYACNIIGPNEERQDMRAILPATQASVESNYFYEFDHTALAPSDLPPSNVSGPEPFINLAAGDLRIRKGITLPDCQQGQVGAAAHRIEWSKGVAQTTKVSQPTAEAVGLQWVQSPVCTSSEIGALVTAYVSDSATGLLRYRKTGTEDWREVQGVAHMLSQGDADAKTPFRLIFPLLQGQLEPNTDYEYVLECTGNKETIHSKTAEFRTDGGPKEIYVKAGQPDNDADGSATKPFPDLQTALDRALPGDTVRIGKGVYTRPAILPYGGTLRAPLVIQGEGERESILDGGWMVPILLEMRGVRNVVIRDLQIRWFNRYGILARNSHTITIERCLFRNQPVGWGMTPDGIGIRLENSPKVTILGSTFTANEIGVYALKSPNIILQHNTGFLNLYSAVTLNASSRDSEMTHNAFTFTGNDSLTIIEPDAKAFASLKSDFNNYAGLLREDTAKIRPENDFQPAKRYQGTGRLSSKHIVQVQVGDDEWRYFTRMKDWRSFSNLDANTIFADPEYVDPLKGDFRLLPTSPNKLKDGTVIGAAETFEK